MKTINQIFENDKHIFNNPAVQELIDYCYELEDQVIENKQSLDVSFETKLTGLINEIYDSIKQVLDDDKEADRFKEIDNIDFKEAMINLKKYLDEFSRYNRFYFESTS